MFVRKVLHKNKKNRKEYHTYKLVESIRTERGPRQRDVLNMGVEFDLPKEQWKDFANCVEETITGQKHLINYPEEIRGLADRYARKIICEQASVVDEGKDIAPSYATINLNSVDSEEGRTVGAEYIVYETIKELQIDQKLRELGFNKAQLAATLGVIAGRIISPGSERATHQWLQNISALDELMDADFSSLSQDRVYKVSDQLLKHKEELEEHLRQREDDLFALEERIILYDLTNTFFEGTGKYNPKARHGRSKEKRSDCLLVTLGLVLDMHGFPRKSRIFEGNVSEPKTMETMIEGLGGGGYLKDSLIKPMVVVDAGIASEKNIQWLKDNSYPYIVVSRKKKKEIPSDVTMIAVKKDDKTNTVLVQAGLARNEEADEVELYCHSIDKEKKEEGIKTRFQERFEAELLKADKALHVKNGIKHYDKVLGRMGRLKEK